MNAQCDFCSRATDAQAMRYVPKAKVALYAPGEPLWTESGDWIACGNCADLIRGREWKALMERAMRLNPAAVQAGPLGLLDGLRQMIATAWSAVFDEPREKFL